MKENSILFRMAEEFCSFDKYKKIWAKLNFEIFPKNGSKMDPKSGKIEIWPGLNFFCNGRNYKIRKPFERSFYALSGRKTRFLKFVFYFSDLRPQYAKNDHFWPFLDRFLEILSYDSRKIFFLPNFVLDKKLGRKRSKNGRFAAVYSFLKFEIKRF